MNNYKVTHFKNNQNYDAYPVEAKIIGFVNIEIYILMYVYIGWLG